jgi:hypothetical protein
VTMKYHQSIYRIVLASSLIVAASATAAHCEFHDPMGMHNVYKPWSNHGPKLIAPNPEKIVHAGSPAHADERVAQRVTAVAPCNTERFDDLNLSVNMPGGSWTKLDPKKTGSRACLLLSRQNPEIFLSLAGERAASNVDNNKALLAASQAKMKTMPGAVLSSTSALSANGIDGILFEATTGEAQPKTHYSIWVAAHNGFNYKLAVFGHQNEQPTIDAAIRTFARGIKHIEPTDLAHTDANPPAAGANAAERKAVTRKPELRTATQIKEHSLLRDSSVRR